MKTPKAKTVAELLERICQAASDGNYLFRGEASKEYPEYPKVTSSLYRVHQDKIEIGILKIYDVEQRIIDEVREHTHEKDYNVILEQLQHYGGKTNQIDFSTDYLIALFFACDGNHQVDGRLILLNTEKANTRKPTTPQNRVIAQKSIFVCPSKGFVNPDIEVPVPSELKKNVLEYLSKYHSVRTATIYNDIHGYIAQMKIHESAYTHFYRGVAFHENSELLEAIREYTKAIELNPNYADAYSNRGIVRNTRGKREDALNDHNKAVELSPNDARMHHNRSMIYYSMGENDLAIVGYSKAIELNPNYAKAYHNRGFVYYIMGKHDLAMKDYNKSIELQENFAKAYESRGLAKKTLEDIKGAREDYETALRLAEQQGDKPLVRDVLRRISKLSPDSDS